MTPSPSGQTAKVTSDVKVKPLGVEQVDAASDFRLRFLAEFYGVAPDSFDASFVAATRSFLAVGLQDGSALAWVVEVADEAVGSVVAIVSNRPPRIDDLRTGQAHLLNLWIDPRFRRRGLGQRLLHVVEAEARRRGLRQLVLHTTDDGRTLYEAAGFRPNELWRELDVPTP